MKKHKVRLLDASNMAARAQVIREKLPSTESGQAVAQDPHRAHWDAQKDAYMKTEQSPQIAATASDSDTTQAALPATKDCPFCAETIKAAAIKCRFCGSELETIKSVSNLPPTTQKPCTQGAASTQPPKVSLKIDKVARRVAICCGVGSVVLYACGLWLTPNIVRRSQ